MAGFRFRHLISAGAPDGARAGWSPFSASAQYIGTQVAGATGVPVYVAPPLGVYDSVGNNPDPLATTLAIQNLLAAYVFPDQTVGANLATSLNFFLYRAGVVVGGGRFAGWSSNNPAFTLGVPVQVPFDVTNTALLVVPGQTAVTTTKALLPMRALDTILVVGSDVTKFVGLWAAINAQ